MQIDGSVSKIQDRPIDVMIAPENLSDLERLFAVHAIKYNIKDNNVQRCILYFQLIEKS